MIPFLLMYIFLNYDCMFSLNNNAKKEKLSNNEIIRESVFKLAKNCAKKFENVEHQKKKNIFQDIVPRGLKI